jgi:hypothetical protein
MVPPKDETDPAVDGFCRSQNTMGDPNALPVRAKRVRSDQGAARGPRGVRRTTGQDAVWM